MSALAKLLRLPQYARNLGRTRFILSVIVKFGFGHIMAQAGLLRLLPMSSSILRLKVDEKIDHESWEVRVRLALETLGPTFIKLGQMLATRADLVPMSLIEELRKLQDDVPAFPWAEVKELLESELGRPIEEAFASVDQTPLAAASIAQVHRATLIGGEQVVLKVQRPGLDVQIHTDLELLKSLADQIEERVPEARQFQPVAIVEQFAHGLKRETDFNNERDNIERFRRQFADREELVLPNTWPKLSTRRVLTMGYIDGCKITDKAQLDAWGVNSRKVAEVGTELVMSAIYEHGFFHADPHPGNFFVLSDGRLALIDFGMMGSLDRERIDDLLAFMAAVLMSDAEMLVTQLVDEGLVDDTVNMRGLRSEIHDMIARYDNLALAELDISTFLTEIFETVVRYGVQMPADLLLIGKSISTMEGIARQIQPDFNPLEAVRPFLVRLYLKRAMDPQTYTRRVMRTLHDWWGLSQSFPRDMQGIMRRARAGELQLNLKHEGQDQRQVQLERQVNRVIMTASTLLCWGLFSMLLPQAEQAGWTSLTTIWTALLGMTGAWTGTLLGFSLLRSREL